MTTLPKLLSILGVLALCQSASAHRLDTRVAKDALPKISVALKALVPSAPSIGPMDIGLFACSGDDASISIPQTIADLNVSSLSLSQPRPGQLALDIRFGVTTSGQVDFNKVIFCGSTFSCEQNISIQNASAHVLLEAGQGEDGLGLIVADSEVELDSDDVSFSLSGCEHAGIVNSVVGLVDTVAVELAEGLVEDLVEEKLAPAIESAALGFSQKDLELLLWDLDIEVLELNLDHGIQISVDADLRSEAGPDSCVSDPGQPSEKVGAQPVYNLQQDMSIALNLGLVDDFLYHAWASSARCPGIVGDGASLVQGMTNPPVGNSFALHSNIESPPRLVATPGEESELAILIDEASVELVAENGSKSSSAKLRFSVKAPVALAMDSNKGALVLSMGSPRLSEARFVGSARVGGVDVDAAQLAELLETEHLAGLLDSLVTRDVSLPMNFAVGGTHLIVANTEVHEAYVLIELDVFNEPTSDTSAPETLLLSSPTGVVSPQNAKLVVGGEDSQIPSPLLRYAVTIAGVEMPLQDSSEVSLDLVRSSGEVLVQVAAVDLAGNRDPSPAQATVLLDADRPLVSISLEEEGQSVVAHFSAEDLQSPNLALSLRIEDEDTGLVLRTIPLAETATHHRISSPPQGSIRVVLIAQDEAGNEGVASAVLLSAQAGGCSSAGAGGGAFALLLLLVVGLLRSTFRSHRRATLALVAASASMGVACGGMEIAEQDAELALPACASPLSAAIWEAIQPVMDQSTISLGESLSTSTWVDPNLYIDGPEIFSKMASMIESAEDSVHIQFYKWEPETDATETLLGGMAALSAKRAQQGASSPVPVRIIIDSSLLGVAAPRTELHMPWVMERFEAYDINPQYVDVQFAVAERGLLDQFGNLHVKTVLVDNKIAMLTGANPEHQHDFDQPWHDLGTVVKGQALVGLFEDFRFTWSMGQEWICSSESDSREFCLDQVDALPELMLPELPAESNSCLVMGVSRRPTPVVNNSVENPQDQAFLAAFDNAQEVIKVETPNVNDDAFKEAVLAAAERGVKVQILTSNGFNEASEQFVGGPNGQNVDELYRSLALRGVANPCEVFEVRWYSKDGEAPIYGNAAYASHTKYASFDNVVAIVGTTNMDTASWNFSHEYNLAIDGAEIVETMDAQLFDADWSAAVPVEQCL